MCHCGLVYHSERRVRRWGWQMLREKKNGADGKQGQSRQPPSLSTTSQCFNSRENIQRAPQSLLPVLRSDPSLGRCREKGHLYSESYKSRPVKAGTSLTRGMGTWGGGGECSWGVGRWCQRVVSGSERRVGYLVVVFFSSLSRILGECLTIDSPPGIFFRGGGVGLGEWRFARAH